MTSFTFNTAKSIVCEPGVIARLGELALPLVGNHVLLVTDPGLIQAGLLEPVEQALKKAGIAVTLFRDTVADPPEHLVLAATDLAKETNVTGVIGFGGGSSLDIAKLAALLVTGTDRLDDIYGIGQVRGRRLPLIQIPTTAGTGSEVTPISIITIGDGIKKGVVDPELLPDLALLDADLTLGLPAHVTAATGIDAMVHAIEAYTSKNPNNNPLSRALAKEALRLLGANIETAVFNGQDRQARSDMLLGSLMAGQAFANSPVAAVHALAYPIGGFFHVPHGLSNALVLPHVLRFNAKVCAQSYVELAPWAFPSMDMSGSVASLADRFISTLARLSEKLGLETNLRQVGIAEPDLEKLAKEAMGQTRLLVNNPRDIQEVDALTIYRSAW
ncbi:iron-containing alcohol dehydrogenase [Coralliovum pocilloporae]|uniref:iron-containing alcohol dehydrogenase n=1 Tax=Coralliovum pocilloporae TaxID=3066369 RepID=UPI003307519B